jgi:hypothetical protein
MTRAGKMRFSLIELRTWRSWHNNLLWTAFAWKWAVLCCEIRPAIAPSHAPHFSGLCGGAGTAIFGRSRSIAKSMAANVGMKREHVTHASPYFEKMPSVG